MSLIGILNEQLNKAGLLKDKAGNIFFQLSEDHMKKINNELILQMSVAWVTKAWKSLFLIPVRPKPW